mmetsp:Transcript_12293/g.21934  ORF Transcript_12293/g.21934 Transcript_12293/m.21934 type:complete len:335 (-) Transcript_12293:153-1157(-)
MDAVQERVAQLNLTTPSDYVKQDDHDTTASELEAFSKEKIATVTVFCCQKCRCALFTEDQLSKQHNEGKHTFGYRRLEKEGVAGKVAKGCTSLFLSEPNTWMAETTSTSTVSGKLQCPKCGWRVGTFAWAGGQCSCGTWIVPSLQFPVSKVDHRHWLPEKLPAHTRSLPDEEVVVEEEDAVVRNDVEDNKPTSPDANATARLETNTPALCEKASKHAKWMEHTNNGDGEALRSFLDEDEAIEECSLTTIQKRCTDGYEKVAAALLKSSQSLKGRITILEGPVGLKPPSTSSRVVFSVDRVEGKIGETLVWGETGKVQHIIRTKNPSEAFLDGAA